MAIYSLHHSSIGKSTQAAPYTAAAHVRYVTRASALTGLEAGRMPADAGRAMAFFRTAEDRDRKNARVCDKVMIALPRELSSHERRALVRRFAEELTQGRAGWLAAFHEGGKDQRNPHCHLIVRDRDPETGKRVIGMSEKGSTERVRLLWEEMANEALAKARRSVRISRLTLKAQGESRRPGIHVGVRARRNARQGRPYRSRPVSYRNGIHAREKQRTVDYRQIDRGSRDDYNRDLRRERVGWGDLDRALRAEEIEEQRRIHTGRPGRHRPRGRDDDFDL